MSTTGELYPGTAITSQVAAGDMAWQSILLSANDGAAANVTATGLTAGIYTQRLKAKGFTMPAGISAGATINGIIVRFEGWGSGSVIATSCKMLGADGAVSGTNKSGTSGMLSATTVIYSQGNSTDKWGMVLNPTLLTDPDFGFSLRCRSRGAANTAKDIWIDYVTLEIIYDLPQDNRQRIKFVEC